MLAGIELGGTKTVVAVANDEGAILDLCHFPTGMPYETLSDACDWLRTRGQVSSLGVAAFGPISLSRERLDYGCLLATPKQGWSGFDLIACLQSRLGTNSITLDTDVNAAVLSEHKLGSARGYDDVVYITIGTGIGAGVLVGGRVLQGAFHSEFGHISVPRHPNDQFVGACSFHQDCLEGMASGTALRQRWGRAGHEIPADDFAWDMEAWYIAQGCLNLLAMVSPRRVVIGGGVSQVEGFHERVEAYVREMAAGYFTVLDETEKFVVPAALGQDAGIQGALLLAMRASEA